MKKIHEAMALKCIPQEPLLKVTNDLIAYLCFPPRVTGMKYLVFVVVNKFSALMGMSYIT